MLRSRMGEMSFPRCTGTVVVRPSACRNRLWEPRCRRPALASPTGGSLRMAMAISGRSPSRKRDHLPQVGTRSFDGLSRLQNLECRGLQATNLGADELPCHLRWAVVEDHRDHLPEIGIQLFGGSHLGYVRRGSPGCNPQIARYLGSVRQWRCSCPPLRSPSPACCSRAGFLLPRRSTRRSGQ